MNPNKIKEIVERLTGLDLRSKSRDQIYINARTVYAKICVDMFKHQHTLKEIGEYINVKHTSIIYFSTKTFSAWISDDAFAELYIMCSDEARLLKKKIDGGGVADFENIIPKDILIWISELDEVGKAELKVRLRAIMNNNKKLTA